MSVRVGGEWYRKHHRGALGHRVHYWTEGRNGCQMLAYCGKEVADERPLVVVPNPTITLGVGRPTGYCRTCVGVVVSPR